MSRSPEEDVKQEKQPLGKWLETKAAGMLGVTESDFLVGDDQWQELEQLCKTATPLIEQARHGAKGRRVTQKLAKVCTEFAVMTMTRALKDPQNASPWLVTGAFVASIASSVTGSHFANEQQRLDQQALRAVFSDMAASPELTQDEDWWKQCQAIMQPEMMNMAWANRALNNRPGEMILWLTAASLNIGQMYPDMVPTVVAAWGGGVAQILGSAKMYKTAEKNYITAGGRVIDSLARHGDVTEQEKREADNARNKVTWSTNMINFITEFAPGLPVIQAIWQGSLADKGMALVTRLVAAQIASGPLKEKLGDCIGAAMTLTAARQGKEFLYDVIEKWREAKVRISTEEDWDQHIKELGPVPADFTEQAGVTGKRLVMDSFLPKRLDGTVIGEARSVTLSLNKIMVVRGESGSGKSSFVESIMQKVKGTTGHVGYADNGHIDWLGTGTMAEKEGKVLFINPGRESGSSFMDRALTEQLQINILSGAGIIISREFARASWSAKKIMASGNAHLTAAYAQLEKYMSDYMKETGLFTDAETPEEMMSRNFGEYSEGQRRRLAMALAGVRPQKLIAFDEPTASLDIEVAGGTSSTDRVVRYLRWLQEVKGKGVICIIHDDTKGLVRKFGDGLGVVIDVEKNGGWRVARELRETESLSPESRYKGIWGRLGETIHGATHILRWSYKLGDGEKFDPEIHAYSNWFLNFAGNNRPRREQIESKWGLIQTGAVEMTELQEENPGIWQSEDAPESRWLDLGTALFSHFDLAVRRKDIAEVQNTLELVARITQAMPERCRYEYGFMKGITDAMVIQAGKEKKIDKSRLRQTRKSLYEKNLEMPDLDGMLLVASWKSESRDDVSRILEDSRWEDIAARHNLSVGETIFLLGGENRSDIAAGWESSLTRKELARTVMNNFYRNVWTGWEEAFQLTVRPKAVYVAEKCREGYSIHEAIGEWRKEFKTRAVTEEDKPSRVGKEVMVWVRTHMAMAVNPVRNMLPHVEYYDSVQLDPRFVWAVDVLKEEVDGLAQTPDGQTNKSQTA